MSELKSYFWKGKWGGGESLSGKGSSLAYTSNLRTELPAILKKYDVRSFLDAPCGDFNWMKEVPMEGIDYIGIDIVDDIVDLLKAKFGAAGREFRSGDITTIPLPKVDMMLCRDCLFHLPWRNCFQFIDNFLASGIPFLLLTSHTGKHRDMTTPGSWRQMNMRMPPFSFPEPIEVIEDWIPPHPRRYVGLWTAEQIRNSPLQRELAAS